MSVTVGRAAGGHRATVVSMDDVMRQEWPKVVATLMRDLGDLELAEDATQDACAQALVQWPERGMPDNPGAWLTTTARRRAIDRLRRDRTRTGTEQLLARYDATLPGGLGSDGVEPVVRGPEENDANHEEDAMQAVDDQLRLIFTCCHPALAPEAQVALTLRSLGGLTTEAIAHAFLVPEPTMAQRLVRAKRKIKNAGIPFRIPADDEIRDRVAAVLQTVYLIFNEGYAATGGGDLVRADLCEEAIRLGSLLHELRPDDREVAGLLALMLFVDARRATRVDADGALVLLEDQDRARWDHDRIAAGHAVLARCAPAAAGPYQLQAEIARAHVSSPSWDETDWATIADRYADLAVATGSPVVELNRAVALAMAEGPAAGLELVEQLADHGDLAGYHLLPATRADLLRRLGRVEEAAQAYDEALVLAPSVAERSFLQRRIDELRPPAR